MKKLVNLILVILVITTGCSDNPASDDIQDRLRLGTGLGRGTVTGITDTFYMNPDTGGVLIQWMLESKYDLGGGHIISILIEEKVGENYVERKLFDYEPADDINVYYYIHSFYHQLGPGIFRATGIVGHRKAASQTYTVTWGNE